MAMSKSKKMERQRERHKRDALRCQDCKYCKRDNKVLGPGWIEMDNNGPIVPCPVCNDNGRYVRQH